MGNLFTVTLGIQLTVSKGLCPGSKLTSRGCGDLSPAL